MSLNLDFANGGSFTLASAGLGIGSTTSQLSTSVSCPYVFEGVFQTNFPITATFALAVPAATRIDPVTGATINLYTYTTIAPGQKSAFGVWVDQSQVATVTQGPVVSILNSTDRVSPPPNPGGRNLIGYVTVLNTSLSANGGWRPGTDAFNAAGVTTAYFNTFSYLAKLGE